MRKTNWTKLFLAMMLALVLALAACSKDSGGSKEKADGGDSNKGKTEQKGGESEEGIYSIEDFPLVTSNNAEPLEDGELTYGVVTDSPFQGTLNTALYSGAVDWETIKWFDEALLDADADFNYKEGAASFEVSDDKKTYTFKIKDNVNWQDGKPVTAEDWAYSFYVIGHKDYTGVRYDDSFRNIKGMEEYHTGKSDKISGLEVVDDKTLKMTFMDPTPSLLAGGIWPYAIPKHYLEDIPVKDLAKSEKVRKKPLGMGPYKVESIVPGESVVLTRNEDYWRGKPALAKLTVKRVDPSVVVKELEQGKVDMVDSFPTDQYPDNADMKNVEFLGNIDMAYTYIGFKLGTWDKKKGEVKPNPDCKMCDKNLRKAMWYAVDNDAVGKKFYHGLRWSANTLIDPAHKSWYAEDVEAPTYDPEKAKQLLEEAGFKDTDGDGIREDKDGKPLTITFASMSGGDTAEPIAKYYIQAWKQVGLNVELLDGKLHDINSFYERVGEEGNDDPKIDIYQGAWSTGTDVDPSGLYGRNALFNFSRYASEENDKLLEDGLSLEAFDTAYRQKVYKEWQQLMVDEVPVFPTVFRSIVVPVNKRVVNYSAEWEDKEPFLYQLGVSEKEPVK
ncbi:oligopeptide ABC transporter substrate-binding protein [Virgibacillus sp. 179-BFC.A HS]|uniref:Oligopeptide ABC transporter substrate-binding protein n=1 Tax=Tigheibacillus jepli TaxID=3035914 RepID=A0ABU5CDN5_9BACI|nr:oligopeptide ABC transporter substrate-binding protein [Virgibacillus sp. 179-BFC.A HS]MDY0404452.1 oligopeptide ABC transporter substrate-binding protein [Virgibacillus sp. 179-BFC.A HS]